MKHKAKHKMHPHHKKAAAHIAKAHNLMSMMKEHMSEEKKEHEMPMKMHKSKMKKKK